MCSNFKTILRFSVLLLLCGINNTMFAYSSIINYFETDTNDGNEAITVTSGNPANCIETQNTLELLKNIAFDVTLSYSNGITTIKPYNVQTIPDLCKNSSNGFELSKNMVSDGTWSYENGIFTIKAYNVETIPDLCKDTSFDAILTQKNKIFVLKDKWYWKLVNKDIPLGDKNALSPGYPKLISQKWPGLPDNIDTAFTDRNDKFTYFFKGSKYWKFDGEKMEKGFPRDIGVDFPGVPNDVQAVVENVDRSNVLYFVKDDMVFNNYTDRIYKNIGLSSLFSIYLDKLEAMFRIFPDKLYYFRGGKYYITIRDPVSRQFHDETDPRPTASHWFGCF